MKKADIFVAVYVLTAFIMFIVTLHSWLLDVFLAINIATAFTIMFGSMFVKEVLDMSYFPHNVEYCGNTASASVALLLDELLRAGKLQRGDKLILSAFGAGFTTGTCLIEWTK